jgi:hypothetical protein
MLVSGCDLVFTLNGPPAPPVPDDAPIDVALPIDGPSCTTPPGTCFVNGMPTEIGCSAAAVAACEPSLFRLCDCGAGEVGGVIVLPGSNPATESDIVFATQISTAISLSYGGAALCPGAPQDQCDIDEELCADGNRRIRRWRNVPQGPGMFQIRIYAGVNPPCVGTPLLSMMVGR